MNINTISSSVTMSQMSQTQRPEMTQEDLLEKVREDFGDEAAEGILAEDGSVDMDKLKELLEENGIEVPQGGMRGPGGPGGPPPGGPPPSSSEESEDEESILERLTAQFGEDSSSEVTNEDGSIDYEKLASYLMEHLDIEGEESWPSGSLYNKTT